MWKRGVEVGAHAVNYDSLIFVFDEVECNFPGKQPLLDQFDSYVYNAYRTLGKDTWHVPKTLLEVKIEDPHIEPTSIKGSDRLKPIYN